MKFIARPRKAGKTTELIREAEKSYSHIICPDYRSANIIWAHALELGVVIPYPITWDEFKTGKYYGAGIDSFMIDDADIILQNMSPLPIKAITVTEESK